MFNNFVTMCMGVCAQADAALSINALSINKYKLNATHTHTPTSCPSSLFLFILNHLHLCIFSGLQLLLDTNTHIQRKPLEIAQPADRRNKTQPHW